MTTMFKDEVKTMKTKNLIINPPRRLRATGIGIALLGETIKTTVTKVDGSH